MQERINNFRIKYNSIFLENIYLKNFLHIKIYEYKSNKVNIVNFFNLICSVYLKFILPFIFGKTLQNFCKIYQSLPQNFYRFKNLHQDNKTNEEIIGMREIEIVF